MANSIVQLSKSSVVVSTSFASLQIGGEGEPTSSMKPDLAGSSGFDVKDQAIGSSTFELDSIEYKGDEIKLGTARLVAFYGFSVSGATANEPVVKVILHKYNGGDARYGAVSSAAIEEAFVYIYPENATIFSVPNDFTIGGKGEILRCIYVDPVTGDPMDLTSLPDDCFIRSIDGSRCLSEGESSTAFPTAKDNLNDLTDDLSGLSTGLSSKLKAARSTGCATCG